MKRGTQRLLRFVALLVAGACLPQCGASDVSLVGSNVLVILVDALRADSLGAYGHPQPISPFVDELAERAVIFERASSTSPHTGPSVLSIISGLYPNRHGLQWFPKTLGFHPRRAQARPAVSETLTLMAEHFARLGYRTGAVVANPWLKPRFGFARGFDVYEHFPRELGQEPYARADRVNELTRALLEAWRKERFFLYLHYMDVHSPYRPPAPYRDEFAGGRQGRYVYRNGPAPEFEPQDVAYTRALYEAEIRGLDDRIREILSELDSLGLASSTLVVITSDHGEAFLEHGGMGHGWALYEELVHSPLLFAHPKLRPVARRSDVLVSGVDLLPTLVELVGGEAPPELDGVSLANVIRGKPEDPALEERIVLSELGRAKSARRGNSKLIRMLRPEQRQEAFDLAGDPAEQRPLSARPPGLDELEAMLTRILPDAAPYEDAPIPAPDGVTEDPTDEQLKALGYFE